jgi:hypothetical protein
VRAGLGAVRRRRMIAGCDRGGGLNSHLAKGLKNVRENQTTEQSRKGRLNLAQDAVLGRAYETRQVPKGRLKIVQGQVAAYSQPSLRDSIILHDPPRTGVLG